MKQIVKLMFLFLIASSVAMADGDEDEGQYYDEDGNLVDYSGPPNELLFSVNNYPGNYKDPPKGLSNSSKGTFKLQSLIGTSINGMLDQSCGGYCITGFCAHLKWGISLFNGIYWYTVFSPRIESTIPDLLVSSYNNVGDEPLKEWRNTYGKVMKAANKSIVGGLLSTPYGLEGGRPDPIAQGEHQTVSFKEVDIIGHPLSILPALVNEGASPSLSGYKIPESGYTPNFNTSANSPTVTLSNSTKNDLKKNGFSINPSKIKIPTFNQLKNKIKVPSLDKVKNKLQKKVAKAIQSMNIAEQVNEIKKASQVIKNIKKVVNTALIVGEASVRSSGIGNFTSPRFRAPRLFCPTQIKPFQPYYSSFLDSFWWRSGYPLTDGPISGSNKSLTILNPVSLDTLPKVTSAVDTIKKEIWGHMYPRDGSINQSHDGKTASVLAWRGMNVLRTSVPSGHRVGVPLLNNQAGKWQMIFPEVKSCRSTPYYPSPSATQEAFSQTSTAGGYAWNYYRTYKCCSNTSGDYLGKINIPKICLNLGDVLKGITEDKVVYDKWVEEQAANDGGA